VHLKLLGITSNLKLNKENTIMTNQTYSGWTNYETWCVNLWLTNESDTESTLRMLAQANAGLSHRADRVQEMVNEMRYTVLQGEASMFTDLLNSALENVNWREIVENHEHDDDDYSNVCNYCGKPIHRAYPFCGKNQQFRAILSTDSNDWLYCHDECFVVATPPEHRTRGGYR
jgi:hypothetical protein